MAHCSPGTNPVPQRIRYGGGHAWMTTPSAARKREREAYAQQMKPEAEDEDIDENEEQDDKA